MLWLEVKKHSSKNVKFDVKIEKGVKYVKKKRLQHDVVLVFLLLTLNIFHTFS